MNDFLLSSSEALDVARSGLVYVAHGTGSGLSGFIARTSTLRITVLVNFDRNQTAIRCVALGILIQKQLLVTLPT